ncbi:MAG: haloacid dehalogenase-like hydrolase [Candidatus Aenigmarchaeota archaeon]|nr:haloacid dehalogenase-like hydrolase [Candidatus Aenigmarchaeota archaeon]
MYRAFNEGVLRYVPLDVVERRVREYAESEETQAEINEPLLRHLADAKKKHGFPAAILSASSRLGIELALQKMGYGKLFDKVVGNDFRETPQGCRFDLRIRERDRTRHLGKLIGDFGAKLETTALMDSRQDLLAIVGYPILSPYAYADSDERMRSELGRQRDHRELVFAEEPSDYERRGPFIVGDSLDFQAILEELAGEPSA